MNWLTIVLLIFVIVMAISGYKMGFAKMLFRLLSTVVALVLVWMLAPGITDMVKDKAKDRVATKIESVLSTSETKEDKEAPSFLESLPLPESLIEDLKEDVNATKEEQLHRVSLYLADIAITAVVYVVCFIVFLLALGVLGHFVGLVGKLPVLKQLNELGGLGLGIVEALILISVFFLLVTAFAQTHFGMKILTAIDESPIAAYLYNHNLLLYLIKGYLGRG